jgi:hypothetical protein
VRTSNAENKHSTRISRTRNDSGQWRKKTSMVAVTTPGMTANIENRMIRHSYRKDDFGST